jgi:hypothetical protein
METEDIKGEIAELNVDEIEQYVRDNFKRLNASFLEASKKAEEHVISVEKDIQEVNEISIQKCNMKKEKKRMLRLIQ